MYNRRQRLAILGSLAVSVAIGGAIPFLTGCGSCGPAEALSDAQIARYAEVQDCTGYRALEPTIQYHPVRACPTSGRRCCFGHEFPCPDGRDTNGDGRRDICSIAGRYSDCDVIHLGNPSEMDRNCGDPFPHEAIHHLLLHNTGDSDTGHKSPRFRECA